MKELYLSRVTPQCLSSCILRSSITRISLEDKDLRSKEVSKQERDILVLNKAGIVAETIQESTTANRHGSDSDSDTGKEGVDGG